MAALAGDAADPGHHLGRAPEDNVRAAQVQLTDEEFQPADRRGRGSTEALGYKVTLEPAARPPLPPSRHTTHVG